MSARLTSTAADDGRGPGGGTVLEIHSRRSQAQRNKVSDAFREGGNLVMFTSDVSARGMDYPDVTRVIQVCGDAEKAGGGGGGRGAG